MTYCTLPRIRRQHQNNARRSTAYSGTAQNVKGQFIDNMCAIAYCLSYGDLPSAPGAPARSWTYPDRAGVEGSDPPRHLEPARKRPQHRDRSGGPGKAGRRPEGRAGLPAYEGASGGRHALAAATTQAAAVWRQKLRLNRIRSRASYKLPNKPRTHKGAEHHAHYRALARSARFRPVALYRDNSPVYPRPMDRGLAFSYT
jgi:hypothetical protein